MLANSVVMLPLRLSNFVFASKQLLSVRLSTLFFCGYVFSSCIFGSQVFAAEPTESQSLVVNGLLMQMEKSARELTYQGTLVYSQGRRMETLKIYHTLKNDQQFERLVHLTGMPREIIRRGDKVICVHPKNGVVELDNSIPAGPFARNYHAQLKSVSEPYTVKLVGVNRVAGRDVNILAVQPKDGYRYGFTLALDKETGLLLQSLMVDDKNRVLERFEYTEIQIGGKLTAAQLSPKFEHGRDQLSLLNLDVNNSVVANAAKAGDAGQRATVAKKHWNIGWLPSGFALSSTKKQPSVAKLGKPSANPDRDSMMYSDGLTAFSVFIAPNIKMSERVVQSGATIAYTSVKKDKLGVYSVTVVGEIPQTAAKNIAGSVTRAASR